MAQDPQITEVPVTIESPERGKPDVQESGDDPYSGAQYDEPIDKAYWIACLSDAERAEETWRKRGREIVQIYRNDGKAMRTGRTAQGDVIFNILYANTEVMLPAVYQKPPKPVVRSRFTRSAEPPPMPMPMPMPPMGMATWRRSGSALRAARCIPSSSWRPASSNCAWWRSPAAGRNAATGRCGPDTDTARWCASH